MQECIHQNRVKINGTWQEFRVAFDGCMANQPTNTEPTSYQVSESGVLWGSAVRPTPKWKRPLLALRESWRLSLAQLLLEEMCSLVRRIAARVQSRGLIFAAGTPVYPRCLSEVGLSEARRYTQSRTRHMRELQAANPWMDVLDVRVALQSWLAGIEFACGIFYSERPDRECASANPDGGNSMPPSGVPQPTRRDPSNPLPSSE